MKRAVVTGVAVSLLASGAAYGYWTTAGAGAGTGATTTPAPLTLTPGAATGRVYPGGAAGVAVTIGNPNTYPIRVGSLSLNTARGTGGFAVDAGHAGCGTSALSFATQSNAGDGWTVPASGSLNLSLPGSLRMAVSAADACQGAELTVYLNTDHHLATTAGPVSHRRLDDDPTAPAADHPVQAGDHRVGTGP